MPKCPITSHGLFNRQMKLLHVFFVSGSRDFAQLNSATSCLLQFEMGDVLIGDEGTGEILLIPNVMFF